MLQIPLMSGVYYNRSGQMFGLLCYKMPTSTTELHKTVELYIYSNNSKHTL